ncbi:lipopolysaccharide biosynthesis protein [Halogeometricum limi]|uniref:Membrane protein involved in the export of O-antigen and teichoic acid n=1 Tax=Halogeometricum limi TaxID=555875 RepID=A0A1I6GH07_9EURY|nr:polysaccharide biosynthesis C-terminal domain-containing protein [Halogeometricum limi]SFR41357.1 Membrane protein involved in the export of O-antigen and teichoic acid [Halogeometricum limi]
MKSSLDLNLKSEALSAVTSKVAMAALGFAGVVIFANELGAEGLGLYYLLLAPSQIIAKVQTGVGTALKKRISEAQTQAGEYISIGLLTHVVVTAVTVAVVVLFGSVLQRYIDAFEQPVLIALIVASFGLFEVAFKVFEGSGYPARASWMDTVRSVLTLGLQLVFLFMGYAVYGLVGGYVLAAIVTAVAMLVNTGVQPTMPSRTALGRTWSFSKWSVPNSLLSASYFRMDVIILGILFVSTDPVAAYETSLRLSQVAAYFAASISAPLVVKMSGLSSIGESVEFDLKNAMSYVGLFALPIFFGALAIPEALMVTVFGPTFSGAGPVLIGLALFQVLNSYRQPIDALIEATDRPKLKFRVMLVTVVVNVALAFPLGWEFGVIGVVAATVIAELTRFVLYQTVAYREFGRPVATRPMFHQAVAAATMFVAVELVTREFRIAGWLDLLFVVGFAGVVYFVALTVLSDHFRDLVSSTLSQLVSSETSDS